MIEVYDRLFVGAAADFEAEVADPSKEHGIKEGWAACHACRDPYHRRLLGYTGRGAPKEHPEYQLARRGTRLYMNIVDTPDPRFFSGWMIDQAAKFISDQRVPNANKVLVHCNEGCSRGPSIALYYLRKYTSLTPAKFEDAVKWFTEKYPKYNPASGIRGFLEANW